PSCVVSTRAGQSGCVAGHEGSIARRTRSWSSTTRRCSGRERTGVQPTKTSKATRTARPDTSRSVTRAALRSSFSNGRGAFALLPTFTSRAWRRAWGEGRGGAGSVNVFVPESSNVEVDGVDAWHALNACSSPFVRWAQSAMTPAAVLTFEYHSDACRSPVGLRGENR